MADAIGYATLPIIPSMQGFGPALAAGTAGPALAAGKGAGWRVIAASSAAPAGGRSAANSVRGVAMFGDVD